LLGGSAAALCGLLGPSPILEYGWQSVFVVGGILPLLLACELKSLMGQS
jgi:hypothetical protein